MSGLLYQYDRITYVHVTEAVVDLIQLAVVGDILINLNLAGQIVFDKARKLSAALHTAESASPPGTTGDKLEPP